MQYFDFILRFDDELHQLTAQNGLPINELSEILSSLYKAIKPDKEDSLVLSEIRGNCYALQVSTRSLVNYETLKVIHRQIELGSYSGLNSSQKAYAKTLKKITSERKLTLQAYNPQKDFIIGIDQIKLPAPPKYYHEICSITGVLTSIGGRQVEGKSAIHIEGIGFEIEVDSEQESKLIKHYKKNRIRLTINKRVDVESNQPKAATLLQFDTIEKSGFLSKVNELRGSLPDSYFEELEKSEDN